MTPILSNTYFVEFNEDAYKKLNDFIRNQKPSSIYILVDENTEKYCLPVFIKAIKTHLNYKIIKINAGEDFKNLATCEFVWNELTMQGADRKSLLINLGGGVITDLGGFAASTFKRGIDFINIPTTLLSMVDASVGGKTGIDLGVLKNQIGMFSNPLLVIIDSKYLKTISDRELRSGIAEIIKYGFTFDFDIWNEIKNLKNIDISNLDQLIHKSIAIKNTVVLKDPKEKNLRKVLNFGHTLGHAIESYFLISEEKENLTHGEAIAVGMVTELYLSHKMFHFPLIEIELIKAKIIDLFGKIDLQQADFEAILLLLIHDKKNVAGNVNFVLLKDFKVFEIDVKVTSEMMKDALQFYLY